MKTKQLDQFMCDWFPSDYEVAVNACWLQDRLRELEECKRAINVLKSRNEMLQTLSIIKEIDCPEYRINTKV